jgi:hypothetical protein
MSGATLRRFAETEADAEALLVQGQAPQTVALLSVLEIIFASVSIWNGFCSAGLLRYSSGKPWAP